MDPTDNAGPDLTKAATAAGLAAYIQAEGIHFLDFGCSSGGSLKRFSSMYNGECRGLGLDIDPVKVAASQKAGFRAQQYDIRQLATQGIRVNFVSMSHFLEHVGSPTDVAKIVRDACQIARHFVVIVQPSFDADGMLMRMGLKPYWSDWSGHPNRMSSLEFHNILFPLYRSKAISSFRIYARDRILTPADPRIIPLETPGNSQRRDISLGPEHPLNSSQHSFPFPVHAETVAIVEKRDCPYGWLEAKLGKMEVIFETPRTESV